MGGLPPFGGKNSGSFWTSPGNCVESLSYLQFGELLQEHLPRYGKGGAVRKC